MLTRQAEKTYESAELSLYADEHLAPSVACGFVLKYNVEQKLKDLLSDAEYEMFDNKFEIKNAPGYRERLENAWFFGQILHKIK